MTRRRRPGNRRLSRPASRLGWSDVSAPPATPVEPFADSDLLMLQRLRLRLRQRQLPLRRSGIRRFR